MENCVFCKILSNELPGKLEKITDNWSTLVPIEQATKGHILVIPNTHCTNMLDIEDEKTIRELGEVLRKISKQQKEKYNADGINILNNNEASAQQTVFHLHYHIMPRFDNDNLDLWIGEKSNTI